MHIQYYYLLVHIFSFFIATPVKPLSHKWWLPSEAMWPDEVASLAETASEAEAALQADAAFQYEVASQVKVSSQDDAALIDEAFQLLGHIFRWQ